MIAQLNSKSVALVLGGARSGKSAFAEKLVADSGLSPIYLATAQIWDDEMRQRVAIHQARRGAEWLSFEVPDALEQAVMQYASPERIVMVDCLTLWVTNLMMSEADIDTRFAALEDALQKATGPVVLVSNEVGLGIVPDNKMAREFRDHAGLLHQRIAQFADYVYFIAAGLPMTLKG